MQEIYLRHLNKAAGFTLVELAIVMTIIGLLIGGILKGQELMENARVTATVAQVQAYNAAVTTFRDMYSAIPGDMPNAYQRIPGCNALCDPPVTGNAGDSRVGSPHWGDAAGNYHAQMTVAGITSTTGMETGLFWPHLLLANLISGVTDTTISSAPVLAWGESHPAAKIGGGFVAGTAAGSLPLPGSPAATGPGGLGLLLVNSIDGNVDDSPSVKPMSAGRAAQIDRRMDDGLPTKGSVQAYGAASCFGDDPDDPRYKESETGKDCGLFFQF
jgi:prepilin-type N-terminal cleavage/methylation domain-containing protein